jgi:4-hydroxy-2-oxoheptanedioate aldolase
MKNFKERLSSGETVHGCWINLGSTVSAEIIGRSGFDWGLIDLEHGAGNDGVMYQQLQVLTGTNTTPIVRIDQISKPKVQRILDAGASGIMFPQIQNAKEAAEVTKMMYYPPQGNRGMAKMVRATGFGKNAEAYIDGLENNIVGVIQIETLSAVDEIDAIAGTNGVDVLFVGPSDLTMAMGIFGQLDHPKYQKAIQDVANAAKKHNKTAGVLLLDIREYEMYHKLGYRFLACGADASFVVKGAADMIKEMNNYRNK